MKIRTSIYWDKEVENKIKKIADCDERSVNQTIKILVSRLLENEALVKELLRKREFESNQKWGCLLLIQ